MSLDPKIQEAIQMAVQASGQYESVSRGLVAWFDAVSSGNEELTHRESTDRRLEHLYGDTVLPRDDDSAKTDKELEASVRKVLENFDLGAEEDAGLGDGGRSGA